MATSNFVGFSENRGFGVLHSTESQYVPTPRNEWRFRPGFYTPRQFVHEIAILLESILLQLGPDPPDHDVAHSSRAILMDGLRSSLSHAGREATLPLADWDSPQPSPLTAHILRIGPTLYQYAAEAPQTTGDPTLTVYSPCEGHKWVPRAGELLRGPRGSPALMMLYNEWLHQLTCLRDYLIAFDNFEEVVLKLGPDDNDARQGTRPVEDVRVELLRRVVRGDVDGQVMLETAKVLMARGLPVGGYGFRFEKGVVLPADAAAGSGRTGRVPGVLLHFHDSHAQLGEGRDRSQRPVLFASALDAAEAGTKRDVVAGPGDL